MSKNQSTLPGLVFKGLEKHPGGLFASTKRKGDWIDISTEEFKETYKAYGAWFI
jgi:hypothetical protein